MQLLGRFLYYVAFYILRLILTLSFLSLGPRLWIRNSFLTSAFVPFKSDLDLTLFFARSPSKSDLKLLKKILLFCKIVFPALGEVNFYVAEDQDLLLSLVNSRELQRDPTLKGLFSKWGIAPHDIQTCVWLLRLFESDFDNLVRLPKNRSAKWSRHFELAGIRFNPRDGMSAELILQKILDFYLEKIAMLNQKAISQYFEATKSGQPQWQILEMPWFCSDIAALLPHRFCFAPKDRLRDFFGPSPQNAFTLEQLAWEIFGIYTQFRLNLEDLPKIQLHLARIDSCLDQMQCLSKYKQRKDEIKNKVARLAALIERVI